MSTDRLLAATTSSATDQVVAVEDGADAYFDASFTVVSKVGCQDWRIQALDDALRHRTQRLGMWLDSSEQPRPRPLRRFFSGPGAEAAVQ